MRMRVFKRVLKFAAPALLTLGLIAGGTVAAQAATGSGNQWRAVNAENSPYMNAWGGGGGYVDDYDSQTANNDFSWEAGSTDGQLFFTPGNCSTESNCLVLSDYDNNPNDAHAGTYTNFNGAPWGTYLVSYGCTVNGNDGYKFYDVHWGGWVAPSGNGGNGTNIYLNSASAWCWVSTTPA